MEQILRLYGFDSNETKISAIGNGLINSTWRIDSNKQSFILQKVNRNIFKSPEDIDYNINLITKVIVETDPSYCHLQLVAAIDGSTIVRNDGDYYRVFHFLNGVTYDVVEVPSLAFEAAKSFGAYTRVLRNVLMSDVRITLPNFHNLGLRIHQFQQSLIDATSTRLELASKAIEWIKRFEFINTRYEQSTSDIQVRITHHDTKISNVLFHEDKGLCVIDLDTVMPGYYISDLGDMFRTYLSPASEEETDLSKVYIRMDYFKAIVTGYLGEMLDELSPTERQYIVFAGQFMIYMQALRFLTDFLNNDVYYGAKYEEHNLNRALNQLTLLQSFVDHETEMKQVLCQEFQIVLE